MNQFSTTTLLELANRVLLNAGEQPTRTLTETVAAKRAVLCVKRAVTDIALLGSWTFLRHVTSPTAFDNTAHTAEVDLNQVEDVWYDGCPLRFREWQPQAQVKVSTGEPMTWTTVNHQLIQLDPWPGTTEQQAKVRVVGHKYPPVMQDGTDTPSIPEVFIDALVARATGAFFVRHLGDPGLGNQYNNEFEVTIQQLRDLDRGAPRRIGNMLR